MTRLITAAEIPRFAGDLGGLEEAVSAIKVHGQAVEDDGYEVHATFQGIGPHYRAAEAEDLLATSHTVREAADDIGLAMRELAAELHVYAAHARTIDNTLRVLQDRATALPHGTPADELEPAVIEEDQAIRRELQYALREFGDVESRTAARINELLPGGRGPAAWENFTRDLPVGQFLELARKPVLTQADLRRLNDLLDSHSDDPYFAAAVVDHLGVEGLLDLSQRMAYYHNPVLGPPISGIRQGLANTLATALHVPEDLRDVPPEDPAFLAWLATPDGRRWNKVMQETREYGMREHTAPEPFTGQEQPTGRYGYHSLLTFLEYADQPYAGQYLDGIVADIVAHQETAPGFDIDRNGLTPAGSLLDRTLELSARDPAAAAMILDPDRSGQLDFALERAAAADTAFGLLGGDAPAHSQGTANAIQAAATGIPVGTAVPPGASPPNETNARIAQHMMDRVAAGETSPAMAPQLGNVAAYYIGDFNHAINKAPLPLHEHGLMELRGSDSQRYAETILRNLGKDPHAYTALMEAQQTYALLTVDFAFDPNTDVSDHYRAGIVEQGAASAGHVVGILTEERANAAYESELDPNLHKDKRLTQNVFTSVSDGFTGRIPFISTAMANEMIDVNEALYASREQEQLENAESAAREVSDDGKTYIKETYASAAKVMAENMSYGAEVDANLDQARLRSFAESGFNNGSA